MKRFLTGTMMFLAAAIVFMAVVPAGSLDAKGENVTFVNRSTRTQHVLAAFGGESCGEAESKEQLVLEPKGREVVESGGAKVCYCVSPAGKIGDCGDTWKKAKAGSKVEIR